jgi:hypothetical protein
MTSLPPPPPWYCLDCDALIPIRFSPILAWFSELADARPMVVIFVFVVFILPDV